VNTLPIRTDPDYTASRQRLRRSANEWLPLGHSSVLARLMVLRHGGHERPVIHRGSKHLRFRFVSVKTGTTQLGEGRGEEFLAMTNEVWGEVHDYECHPFRIEFMRDGKLTSYRPDAVRMFVDGTIEVIECKRTPDDLNDEEYRETLALVAEICRRLGMVFRVLYLHDIMGPRERQQMSLTCMHVGP
jgi:hypothetical protein